MVGWFCLHTYRRWEKPLRSLRTACRFQPGSENLASAQAGTGSVSPLVRLDVASIFKEYLVPVSFLKVTSSIKQKNKPKQIWQCTGSMLERM